MRPKLHSGRPWSLGVLEKKCDQICRILEIVDPADWFTSCMFDVTDSIANDPKLYLSRKTMSTPSPVIVTIDGHRYDVTAFIPNHPGEKPAKNVSLKKYPDQDITQLFAEIHDVKPARKEKARGYLDQARQLGEYNGIKYLGAENGPIQK